MFYALVRDGMKTKDIWLKNLYIELYPQTTNCALLYHPEASVAKQDDFLHLNPRVRFPLELRERTLSLRDQLLREGTIMKRGHDRSGQGTSDVDSYAVLNWALLAASLSLRSHI